MVARDAERQDLAGMATHLPHSVLGSERGMVHSPRRSLLFLACVRITGANQIILEGLREFAEIVPTTRKPAPLLCSEFSSKPRG
jgi:hypothetical protein